MHSNPLGAIFREGSWSTCGLEVHPRQTVSSRILQNALLSQTLTPTLSRATTCLCTVCPPVYTHNGACTDDVSFHPTVLEIPCSSLVFCFSVLSPKECSVCQISTPRDREDGEIYDSERAHPKHIQHAKAPTQAGPTPSTRSLPQQHTELQHTESDTSDFQGSVSDLLKDLGTEGKNTKEHVAKPSLHRLGHRRSISWDQDEMVRAAIVATTKDKSKMQPSPAAQVYVCTYSNMSVYRHRQVYRFISMYMMYLLLNICS